MNLSYFQFLLLKLLDVNIGSCFQAFLLHSDIYGSHSLTSPESGALTVRRYLKKIMVLITLLAGLQILDPKFYLFYKYLYLFLPIVSQASSLDNLWILG